MYSKMLNWMKSYYVANRYFVQFVTYTACVTLIAATFIIIIQSYDDLQDQVGFLDAWFISISAFSCTGLAMVDYTRWHASALVVVLLTIMSGNMVACSAAPSILRLRTLHRKYAELEALEDSAEKTLFKKKVHLYITVNRTIIWSCLLYTFNCYVFPCLLLMVKMTPWWSIFHVVSAFGNVGVALSSSSFSDPELAGDEYTLLIFVFMMTAGGLLYPLYQRVSLIYLLRFLRSERKWVAMTDRPRRFLCNMSTNDLEMGLAELLRNPRKYYTHIFPNQATIYMVMMWAMFTALDFAMFYPEFESDVFPSHAHELVATLFQSTARTTGFSLVILEDVKQGHLLYWALAMYLSSYPFIITEQLSRYQEDKEQHEASPPASPRAPVAQSILANVRNDIMFVANTMVDTEAVGGVVAEMKGEAQLTIARELGCLYLCIIAINFFENHHLYTVDPNDGASSFTRVVFEVASSYGCVGLSLSVPSFPTVSFSGSFRSNFSKLIIVVLIYCGKFRGLPASIDLDDVERLEVRTRKQEASPDPVHGSPVA